MILFPVENLGRKPLSRTSVSAGSKRSSTVSAEARDDGQCRQEAETGGLVYLRTRVSLFQKYGLTQQAHDVVLTSM